VQKRKGTTLMQQQAHDQKKPIITLNLHNLFYGVYVPDWVARIPTTRLTAQAKLVYGRLLRYAGRGDLCNPKVATLAHDLGCSDRTILRSLRELRREGLVSTERKQTHLRFVFYWHPEITRADVMNEKRLEERLSKHGYNLTVAELFQKWDAGCDNLSHLDEGSEEGQIRQPVRSDTTTCHITPLIKENHLRESFKNVHTEPEPKAFTTSFEGPGPEPKLVTSAAAGVEPGRPEPRGFESGAVPGPRSFGEQPLQDEPADRLAAARAREASLKAQASKLEKIRNERQTSKRSNEKEEDSAAREKTHTEASAYRTKAASARRAQNPSYRSAVELRGVWVEEVHKVLPELTVAPWRPSREGRTLRELQSMYDGKSIEQLFQYVLRNWPALRRRFFRGKGGPIPTLSTLIRFHDCWMAESIVWAKYSETLVEVDAWIRANKRGPQGEMRKQYEDAKRELASLDLGN
jgi:hypothetical protein